jgi:hypothetical protein
MFGKFSELSNTKTNVQSKINMFNFLKTNNENSNLAKFFCETLDETNLIHNQNKMDDNIKNYFAKFVYLVEADMESIENSITLKLQKQFNLHDSFFYRKCF